MVKNRKWCTPGIHLESLLSNINTLDMFFEQKDGNFAAYADDNISCFCDKNLKLLLK